MIHRIAVWRRLLMISLGANWIACCAKGKPMANSRAKGSGGEREVAAILHDQLGLAFKRDLEQYRSADRGDLLCVDMDFPLVIEVKRYAKGGETPRGAWWDQCCKAATAAHKWPLLVWRYDRMDWRWRLPVALITRLGHPLNFRGVPDDTELDWSYAVEMDTRTAMTLIREVLAHAPTIRNPR
jgi:Holliday junction resolvase